MFSWSDKVSGTEGGISRVIGNNYYLAGPSKAFYVHSPVDHSLSCNHENVARTANLVHLRHGFGAEGQCGNSLSPAYFKDPTYSGDVSRHQRWRWNYPVFFGWRDHKNFFYSGYPCRYSRHQYCGGISGAAPRHINAHPAQRSYQAAKSMSKKSRFNPLFTQGMELFNSGGC